MGTNLEELNGYIVDINRLCATGQILQLGSGLSELGTNPRRSLETDKGSHGEPFIFLISLNRADFSIFQLFPFRSRTHLCVLNTAYAC